jgi:hypothetical protein
MIISGMMRLSEIDQQKVGKDNMKLCIKEMTKFCNYTYYLKIGNIDIDVLDYIEYLGIPFKFTEAPRDYSSGWMFDNYSSLEDLYNSIDIECDWVIYPDADTILPENTIELIQEANQKNCNVIRFHYIECFGAIDKIIKIKQGYPIGPHFMAAKYNKDLKFIGSSGFNEPSGDHSRYETQYCMRHLRYANNEGIEKRKNMNYYQSYFLENNETVDYKPLMKIDYYFA